MRILIKNLNQTNFTVLEISDNEVWLRVIVRLKDESGIEIIGNKTEKKELIKQKEEWFEPKLSDTLSVLSDKEVKDIRKHSDGFGAYISQKGLNRLINNPNVKEITWPRTNPRALLDDSAIIINANDAWNILGYTGDNVDVCVIDTGVDANHPDLSGKIIDEKCYCSDNCCPNNQDEDGSAEDGDGHGTQSAGVVASEHPSEKGIAYGSDLYVVK